MLYSSGGRRDCGHAVATGRALSRESSTIAQHVPRSRRPVAASLCRSSPRNPGPSGTAFIGAKSWP